MAPRRTRPSRRGPSLAIAAVVTALVLSCQQAPTSTGACGASDAAGPPAQPPPTTSATRAPAPPDEASVDAPALLAQVQSAAGTAAGDIVVVLRAAAGHDLVAGPSAEEPRYTASLVKMLVAAELLACSAAGQVTLAIDDLSLMQAALTSSDDAAMDALWTRHDGPALVAAAADRSGLRDTSPPSQEGQWGESLMSAADVATFLSRLPQIYGSDVARTLTGWLSATTPAAADGFDQQFGVLRPSDGAAEPPAAKQGWMCCIDDRRQLHSVGLLPDGRAVVLLGDFPEATSWTAASDAMDAAASAVTGPTAPPLPR